jgi:hypothetical protein
VSAIRHPQENAMKNQKKISHEILVVLKGHFFGQNPEKIY